MARPVSIRNDAILDAARRVFLKRGYKASTVQVARAAGVSEGTLFKHFRTKQALFLAAMAVESQEQDWEKQLMQSVGTGAIRPTLEAVGRQLLRHLQVMMPCIMMVSASGVTFTRAGACAGDPPPLRLIRVLTRYFRAERKAGRLAMPAPAMQAHAFIGAISHYVFCESVFQYRSGRPAAYVHTVVDTILKATGTRTALGAGARRTPVRGA